MKTVFLDRLLHCQDWLLLLILHYHLGCRLATDVCRLAHYQCNQLPVETHLLIGEERLVVNHGSRVVQSRHILRHKHRQNTRHLSRFGGIASLDPSLRMGRGHIPDLQCIFPLQGNIVRINSLPRNMFVTTLMRGWQRLRIRGLG